MDMLEAIYVDVKTRIEMAKLMESRAQKAAAKQASTPPADNNTPASPKAFV